jgi:hypothetical protein
MLTFCSHPECLDRELRFLIEVEGAIWQQSPLLVSDYQIRLKRFRDDFSNQAVRNEP